MEFLKLQLSVLLIILREAVLDGLLQLVLDITTHITHLNLGLLADLVALFHQIPTTLLGGYRDVQTDDLTIVLRRDAHIGIHDGLLDVTDLLTIPGLDGDGTRIGHTDVGHLIQRHLTTVEFYTDTIEDGNIGTACTHTIQLLLKEHRCHLHALLTFLQSFFYIYHNLTKF